MSERSGGGGQENHPPHFISQRGPILFFPLCCKSIWSFWPSKQNGNLVCPLSSLFTTEDPVLDESEACMEKHSPRINPINPRACGIGVFP